MRENARVSGAKRIQAEEPRVRLKRAATARAISVQRGCHPYRTCASSDRAIPRGVQPAGIDRCPERTARKRAGKERDYDDSRRRCDKCEIGYIETR